MNQKLFFILLSLFSVGVFLFCVCYPKNEIIVIPTFASGKVFYEEKIQLQDNNYRIYAAIPITDYKNLNNEIKDQVNEHIKNFQDSIADSTSYLHQLYTFDLWYHAYSYQNFLSFHFYVSTYTGGAHPNTYSFSINYDIDKKKTITINDLNNNDNFYKILSSYTYDELLKSGKFTNTKFEINLLKDGTSPRKENFKTFAITSEGLIIFFDRYQVAPYAYGEFQVVVPYRVLGFSL